MGEVLINAFKDICLAPACIIGFVIIWFIGIWLLTAYARHLRVKRAGENNTEVTTQNLLFASGPLLLIGALLLFLLAQVVPILLVVATVVVLVIGLPFLAIYTLADYMPDIIRWILDHLGKFGEKILGFITRSPRLPLDSAARSAGTATTLLETFLSRAPSLRTLTRHSSAWIFQVTGLNRQSILLTAASNNKIPLRRRLTGVTGLTRLKDAQGLHRLACDPANHIEVRVQAVQALEEMGDAERTAQAWHAIGRQHADIVRRLDAADNLIRLKQFDTAHQILHDYLSHVDGAPKFHILAARLLASTSGAQIDARRILKDYSQKNDPRLRLKAAAALCALDKPAETRQPDAVAILQNLAADRQGSLPLRQTAVKALEHHECTSSLEKLVNQPDLEHLLQRKVILALERLGQLKEASQAWEKLAQDANAEPLLRIQAAEAFGRLKDAESGHELLMSLAGETGMQPQHLLGIAQALLRLGISEDGEMLLRQLSDGLTSNDPVQKAARQTLESIRSGHYGDWLKVDQIGS